MQMLTEAIRLADMGYRVFPCKPGGKQPLTEHGCKDATSNESIISQWWTRWPDANIGVSTDGLLVVDVDPLPDGSRNPWSDDVDVNNQLLLSAGSITPRGGTHYWYQQRPGSEYRNTASKIAPNVDTRGNGGYVLVPPSRVEPHGDYRWMPFFDICPKADLAYVPDILATMLDESTARRVSEVLTTAGEIAEGGRNDTLASIAGHLRRIGMHQAEMIAAIRAVNIQRCRPPLDDEEVDAIAESVSRYEPDQLATALAEGWFEADFSPEPDSPPVALPDSVMSPGGLLGEIIDYNLATAHKRQPELALAGALALLATLTGRKVEDDRRTRTNVYILALADSGAGKEHARKIAKAILTQSGVHDDLLGPEGIGSAQGLVKALSLHQALLFQLDEIGKVLSAIRSAASAPHLQAIPSTLLRLYSSSDSTYISDAVVDEKRVLTIEQPHCVLYGTTVPKSFFEALTPDSLRDGFVSRLLVFEAFNNDPDPQEPERLDVPASVVEAVQWWASLRAGAGNLADLSPTPRVVTPDEGARQVYRELDAEVRLLARAGDSVRELWVRTSESARKLALLHCVSLNREATILPRESAVWGATLALHLVTRMAWLATQHVAESTSEDQCKRVLRMIAEAGVSGITASTLTRRTQWMRMRDRQEVLATLLQAGQIQMERDEGKGRPTTTYSAVAK